METETILAITTFFSSLAAVLAWVSKLLWSKEYRLAKEELEKTLRKRIVLLESQVKALVDLSPVKMRERFIAIKSDLEEYIDELEAEIRRLKEGMVAETDNKERLVILEKEKEGAIRKEQLVNELVNKLPSAFDKYRKVSLSYRTTSRDSEYVKYYAENS
jgi:hypothetical protein